jgi:hypothetical protein
MDFLKFRGLKFQKLTEVTTASVLETYYWTTPGVTLTATIA